MAEIEWIEKAEGVDRQVAAPRGVPCDACGSPVEALDKFCGACGTANPNYRETSVAPGLPGSPESPRGRKATGSRLPAAVAALHGLRCNTCGAEVTTDVHQRSYTCPFCDSNTVVEFSPQVTGRDQPEFVIGFGVTPDQAQATFQQWLGKNNWFRPGDLALGAVADKMKGIYLPFWSFSMLAQSNWQADIGEYWYRTEHYTTTDSKGNTQHHTRQVQETEWWNLGGKHHRYHSGFLVSGSRGLTQVEAQRVMPFQLPALKRYEAFFIAGWLCEEYSVAKADAQQVCMQEFYQREQAGVADFLPGDTHANLRVRTDFGKINSDLCLLPLYVLSYRYQGKLYRFLLNGQTGKADGEKPVSWPRILLAIGAGVALVLGVIGLVMLLNQH